MEQRDTAHDTAPVRQNRGRPRKVGGKGTNPRDHIISTAVKLFRERGYAKTSLSEIARQVGLDQSSLYYWFPSKEAILESIFDIGDPTPVMEHIDSYDLDHTTRLYALIVFDMIKKCELPFDFIELESLAHDNPERFEALFRHYRTYYQAMVSIIEQGIDAGEFIPCNADERTVIILSVNEGLQHHYHAKQRGELILEASGYTVRNYSPESIGRLCAASTLPAFLAHPERNLATVAHKVHELLEDLERNEAV